MAKFTNEAFEEIWNVEGASVSPNARYVVYDVSGQSLEDDKNLVYMWLHDVKTGANRQLTFSGNDGRAVWMDDETLVFPAVRDDKVKKLLDEKKPLTVFYALNIHGGEARELFRVNVTGASARPIDGNRWMIYGTVDNSPEGDGNQKLYEVYDEYPYHADGRAYVNKKRASLFVYNMLDGQLTPVTEPLFQTNQIMNNRINPVVSPDRKRIYYWGEVVTGTTSRACDAYVYDIEAKKSTKLFSNDKYMLTQCFEWKGRVYFIGYDLKEEFYGVDLMSVSPEGGDYRVEVVPDDYLIGAVGMDDCLWLVYARHDKTEIFAWTPGKEPEYLFTPEYVIEGRIERAGDVCFFTGRRPLETRQLVRLNGYTCTAVTKVSEGLAEKYGFSPSQPVNCVAPEGHTVHGWVLAPHDYKPGNKYPALLTIHGGPQGAYWPLLYPSMQRYAAEGYFVLFCNPRGSTNYGRKYMDLKEKFGVIDFADIMAFTDCVLEQYPDIDPNRMGVTGGSYGGYMTNWIIGHTDRFKAAIAQRSISNWISFYGCTDISYFAEWGQGGTPWRNMESIWWHSPLKYADNFKTPTLFLQNDKDFRCPVEQAEQMLTALIERGIPARMVLFHNASHSVMSPKQQRINDDEVLAWLNKYTK